MTKHCKFCNKEINLDNNRLQFCSNECRSLNRKFRRIKTKMTKEEYKKYIEEKEQKLRDESLKSKSFKDSKIQKIKLSNKITSKLSKNIVRQPGIYCILNKLNNKIYIGSSNNIKRRGIFHFTQLRNGKHFNSHLQHAWNKYGEFNFEFYIIELVPESELEKTEENYIKETKSSNRLYGYNKTDICAESQYRGVTGSAHPLFGRKRPKEVMEPMRKASRGGNNYRAREVEQLSLSGEVLNSFDCIADAARHVMDEAISNKNSKCHSRNLKSYRTNIGIACKNHELKRKYAGYMWRYS